MPSDLRLRQGTLTPRHLARQAGIAMRQSRPQHGREPLDSPRTQRALAPRADDLGGHPERLEGFDGALCPSAAGLQERDDFQALAAALALGHVGMVCGWPGARLARNHAAWDQCLE